MAIDIQTLNDAIIAVITTVGIAVAVSIAIVVAATLTARGKLRSVRAAHPAIRPADVNTSHDTRTPALR